MIVIMITVIIVVIIIIIVVVVVVVVSARTSCTKKNLISKHKFYYDWFDFLMGFQADIMDTPNRFNCFY